MVVFQREGPCWHLNYFLRYHLYPWTHSRVTHTAHGKHLHLSTFSTQHLGFPLHCSTDLLSTPTLPISLKYLLAQLGSKAGILQPSHWLGPGEDFPFGEAVSCFPSPFTSEPAQRDLLLQKAAKDSGSDGLGKQRAGTTIHPSLHTVFWKG